MIWIVTLLIAAQGPMAVGETTASPRPGPRIVVSPSAHVVLGDRIEIRLEELEPLIPYQLAVEFMNPWGTPYRSISEYVADSAGTVDLRRDAPVTGSYTGADPLGVFWSAGRAGAAEPVGPLDVPADSIVITLSLRATDETTPLDRKTVTAWLSRPGVRRTEIRDGGVVAALYEPVERADPAPLVAVIGGSGGGMTWQREIAATLASHGYNALAVAYFNGEGLPGSLSEIPMEYFRTAIARARQLANGDSARVAIVGLSRGAEAALLAAASFPEISAVVAYAPSFVSFMGQRPPDYPLLPSWTMGGQPVAYVPTRELRPYNRADNEAERHLRYLIVHRDQIDDAAIPVERIAGPVLLFSGGADPIWPSRLMSEIIMARLREDSFGHACYHHNFEQAGHAFARPGYQSTVPGGFSGGDPRANAHAQQQSWNTLLRFLAAWRDGGPESRCAEP